MGADGRLSSARRDDGRKRKGPDLSGLFLCSSWACYFVTVTAMVVVCVVPPPVAVIVMV